MMSGKYLIKVVAAPIITAVITSGILSGSAIAADEEETTVAFPDKYMVRLGAYIVDGSDTQFSVSGSVLGTVIDFSRDLGGESRDTIPRVDAYYRFNPRHRIDFTSFSIDRKGSRTLAIDVTIDDKTYSVNETLNSDIKYTLYKLGYAYSFYHSPKVELSVTAGLNFTSYDFKFSDTTGANAEAAGFTAPLPMFGLRMGYAITPKWSVNYVAESFFIEFEDKIRGALINYELNTEYKLFKNFAIGAGLARIGSSLEVSDDDYRGKVSDSYRGYTVFGSFYF
jgi:hypothetical protein